jgi:23S rRNA (cytosine1962-C5)-methyltransferase
MRKVVVKGKDFDVAMHPWIYSKRVVDAGEAEPGEAVLVYSTKGKLLGSAIYNPKSKIALRLYSRERAEMDYYFIKERIMRAEKIRRVLYPEDNAYRMVFGECDGIPGLVVDRYNTGFVIQILSIGIERRKRDVVEALVDLFDPEFIYEKSDAVSRREEGLPEREGILYGSLPDPLIIQVSGIKYKVDLVSGQKTGFFFDQRDNRIIVERYAKNKHLALDLFSYTGGFTLHLLRAGVKKVYAVDRSKRALKLLQENLELNGFDPSRVVIFEKDVFDFLDEMILTGEQFDFIIIDPPSFTHKREGVESALKGYRTIHDRAIRLLSPEGLIATFTCAHYVTGEDLLGTFWAASKALGRPFYLFERLHQSKDHPVLLGFSESEYLKGFLLGEVNYG